MSEVDSIAGLVVGATLDQLKPYILDAPEGRSFLVHPHGDHNWAYTEITTPNKAEVLAPQVITQTVQLQTVDSIIEYVNNFKNSDSVVFADIERNTILSIIDYHQIPEANRPDLPSGASAGHKATPSHGKHRANLVLPFSQEWQVWMGSNNHLMQHKDFATFLEENSIDILPLTRDGLATTEDEANAPTTLLELTRSLQVVSKVDFTSSVRHGSYDKVDFQKADDATARGSLQLPVSFTINIPVYFGERPIQIQAFIRKRIDDGTLKIGYSLSRVENARQMEFHRIVGTIAGSVGLSTVYGKPAA